MSEIIKPDLNFTKEIIASGGDSLKKCYQCSTCTVVCEVTEDNKPFPRKEMLYAQWGLKDKLINSPDIWLCHQCSDCTSYCPRGAKPGEVLGAVRKMVIKNYSKPWFLANWVSDYKYMFLLFAIPILIFMFELFIQGHLTNGIPRGEGGVISYSMMFPPTKYIDPVFIAITIFATVSFVLGIKSYWDDMSKNYRRSENGDIKISFISVIKDILTHKKFKLCKTSNDRSFAHLLILYSFIGLTITTAIAGLYLYGFKKPSPYLQTNIIKFIGNISGIALLFGITLIVNNRLKNKEKLGFGSYFDWFFISIIYMIVLTGLFSEILRLADVAAVGYYMYFTHLVFVFALFAYAPFSKMAHMVYRTTAMVFARYVGKEK